jgi:NADH:ubiquinone oxidoreductase subunit 5 (subunit L)/multisubunit Na+/H+ antiporter MnhA subunit
MMTQFFHLILLMPLLGFIMSLLIPEKWENLMSRWTFGMVGVNFILLLLFAVVWMINGAEAMNFRDLSLLKSQGYHFFIDFYFDKVSAIYGLVGGFLTFLITVYSRYYLHREKGYKRFFNTLWFFNLGYNWAVFSGNLETLFVGWEILGISSFLLISFYRERYLPVKNAVRVFSIYRIGDVGLILAMWLMHHFWQENITFSALMDQTLVREHLSHHNLIGATIGFLVLISAYAKSAQLPFSSWLPRAMEGPTPSSAIFYGSLSVHLGVFLMLRMYPFLESQYSVRVSMIILGMLTAFITTNIARVQSSVKSQIAYASIAQIGLIFIEIGFGWVDLALFHFAGNAFLRTYQLLVSPSVVSYMIREQFYEFKALPHSRISWVPKRWMNSLYIMSLKEFNLEKLNFYLFWNPLKKMGRTLSFLRLKHFKRVVLPLFVVGIGLQFYLDHLKHQHSTVLSVLFALLGLMWVLRSFAEKSNVIMAWWLIALNHAFIALAVSFNEHFTYNHVFLYMSGVFVSAVGGHFILSHLIKKERSIGLHHFQGHVYEYKGLTLLFLICGLGISGFPITPSFVGEDLIFSHIHEHQWLLATLIALSFIVDGLAMIRIYSRVFLGPHAKSYHEVAFRSS